MDRRHLAVIRVVLPGEALVHVGRRNARLAGVAWPAWREVLRDEARLRPRIQGRSARPLLKVQLLGLARDVVVYRDLGDIQGGGRGGDVEVALAVLGSVELQDAVEDDIKLRVGVPERVQRRAARVERLFRAWRTNDLPRRDGGYVQRAACGGCGW